MNTVRSTRLGWLSLAIALCVTALIYWPGLSGGWLFDDYPNIVDNVGVQPKQVNVGSLISAALSSPASEFKRPLASLSFALNFLVAGLDPFWMKLTNLVVHLLNGYLVFILCRQLLALAEPRADERRRGIGAALIACGWLWLPINLTAVLYTVQRMESIANLFVLLGLIGYVTGRTRMRATIHSPSFIESNRAKNPHKYQWGGFALSAMSIVIGVVAGVLAKETAVLLPLYAILIEWILLRFRSSANTFDFRLLALFVVVLALPMIGGTVWLIHHMLVPEVWATRDFTLTTRLLSETRVVVDYIVWTLIPTPHDLSFYHDDFPVSVSLFAPWTTGFSVLLLLGLIALAVYLRNKQPLVSLGIALFLACQLLTATVLPLELVYEHRNYFASLGLLIAIIPLLVVPKGTWFALPRGALALALFIYWGSLTGLTAYAWGNPLRLAENLAWRAPESPRAQYELGRTYIIYSGYDSTSPFRPLAEVVLERASSLPGSSILPEQALIFMNSRMRLPIKDAWWDAMMAELKVHRPTVQDESSLAALVSCARDGSCVLPQDRMVEAFNTALSHPAPSARLLATYSDYAWNLMGDRELALKMIERAVTLEPVEPAYRITLARMALACGKPELAQQQIASLRQLNIGGRLNDSIRGLEASTPESLQ